MKKENQQLEIDITTNDAEELRDGACFEWTFKTDKGESIDIYLFNPDVN